MEDVCTVIYEYFCRPGFTLFPYPIVLDVSLDSLFFHFAIIVKTTTVRIMLDPNSDNLNLQRDRS